MIVPREQIGQLVFLECAGLVDGDEGCVVHIDSAVELVIGVSKNKSGNSL